MRVASPIELNPGSIVIVLAIAVTSLAIAIPATGIRPYGERAILEQIDREDGALCGRLGRAVGTSQFADCMIALADLRSHHVDLLNSYSWM
ncbi:MAG TPA: hypothetical protein VGI78_16860 [Acetobacteraceae bacterium]|jgi:hypothetical protein